MMRNNAGQLSIRVGRFLGGCRSAGRGTDFAVTSPRKAHRCLAGGAARNAQGVLTLDREGRHTSCKTAWGVLTQEDHNNGLKQHPNPSADRGADAQVWVRSPKGVGTGAGGRAQA